MTMTLAGLTFAMGAFIGLFVFNPGYVPSWPMFAVMWIVFPLWLLHSVRMVVRLMNG